VPLVVFFVFMMMLSVSGAPLDRGNAFESAYIHEFRTARGASTLSARVKNNSFAGDRSPGNCSTFT
jgi:hypothetical protein